MFKKLHIHHSLYIILSIIKTDEMILFQQNVNLCEIE